MMTKEEKDNIIRLLNHSNDVNVELGIQLAHGLGMSNVDIFDLFYGACILNSFNITPNRIMPLFKRHNYILKINQHSGSHYRGARQSIELIQYDLLKVISTKSIYSKNYHEVLNDYKEQFIQLILDN